LGVAEERCQTYGRDRSSSHPPPRTTTWRLDGGTVVVEDEAGAQRMLDHLLDPERTEAAIGIARSADPLWACQLRTVIGPGPRTFYVHDHRWLELLASGLGRHALTAETIKIWWPGLTAASDASGHPAFVSLEEEDPAGLLAELARVFHLSRPVVHREIRQLEDLLALAERELAQSRQAPLTRTEPRPRDRRREAARPARRRRDR
jgi:hypothetical protein